MANEIIVEVEGKDSYSDELGKLRTEGSRTFDSLKRDAKSAGDAVGKDLNAGFDQARDAFDDGERRVVGFRDALTGTGDVMRGFRTGDLVTLSTGVADLASSFANLGVDALKMAGNFVKTAAARVADTAATAAHTVAQYASAAATNVMTAAQWALNAALAANPIFLVVAALAALVAGFIIAYNTSDRFREIVTGALGEVADAAVWLADQVDGLGGALEGVATRVLPHISTEGRILADIMENAARGVDKLKFSALDAASAGQILSRAFSNADRVDRLNGAFENFNDVLNDTGDSAGNAGSGIDLVEKKQQAVESATAKAESAMDQFRAALDGVTDAGDALTKAQERLDQALKGPSEKDRRGASNDLTNSRLGLKQATYDVEDAQKRLTEAQRKGDPKEAARAATAYASALQRRKEAQERVSDAQERYNEIATWTAENDPKVAQAQDGVTAAAERLSRQTEEAKEKYEDANKAAAELTETQNKSLSAFGESGAAMDTTKRKAEELAAAYKQISAEIRNMIVATVEASLSQASKVDELDALRDRVRTQPGLTEDQRDSLLRDIELARMAVTARKPGGLQVGNWSLGGSPPKRAFGGPASAFGQYIVGDGGGPELLTMGPQSGHITPLKSGGGGASRAQVVVDMRGATFYGFDDFERRVTEAVVRASNLSGGLPIRLRPAS